MPHVGKTSALNPFLFLWKGIFSLAVSQATVNQYIITLALSYLDGSLSPFSSLVSLIPSWQPRLRLESVWEWAARRMREVCSARHV